MNQTYLQALSSDMDSREDAVFFEATPENIAAFLYRHRRAEENVVGTVDSKPFLTARMGLIDICPDQRFLSQKLLPVYAKVQIGERSVPALKLVSREQALAEKCPAPDWNYLRWDGYSDRKYQSIQSGEALLHLFWHGKNVALEVQVRSYYDGGKLAVTLVDWLGGAPEYWADLTVNLGCRIDKDCAFINVNHLGGNILPWIEKNGLGVPTGRIQRSGFVTYPEYRFNLERLQELDDLGYLEYSRHYDSIHGPEESPEQNDPEKA